MPDNTKSQKSALWQALGLAWEFGYLIVVPLVLFGLGGRWLDGQFDTSPWLFLSGMILSVIITTSFMVRKFSRLLRDMNESSKPPKP